MTKVKELRAILAELPDDMTVWTGTASGAKITTTPLANVLPVNMGGSFILVLTPEAKRATGRPCLLEFFRNQKKTFKNFTASVRDAFIKSRKHPATRAMDGLLQVADKVDQEPTEPST